MKITFPIENRLKALQAIQAELADVRIDIVGPLHTSIESLPENANIGQVISAIDSAHQVLTKLAYSVVLARVSKVENGADK